jgi:hypothetical protein
MSTQAQSRPIDQEELNALLGQAVQDMGAALLIVIGDRLGLYRAMADGKPLRPAELATRTGTAERYVVSGLMPMRPATMSSITPIPEPTR